eukprot:15366001-Ditylum_brightwellii.AAC.1
MQNEKGKRTFTLSSPVQPQKRRNILQKTAIMKPKTAADAISSAVSDAMLTPTTTTCNSNNRQFHNKC